MSVAMMEPDQFDRISEPPPPNPRRARLQIPVDMQSANISCAGVTANVSPGGAFVATPWMLPVGERITMKLAVPGYAASFVVKAEVRWFRPVADADGDSRPGGIGVQFVDPPAGVELCLAELLQSRAPG